MQDALAVLTLQTEGAQFRGLLTYSDQLHVAVDRQGLIRLQLVSTGNSSYVC